jgi:hypothetical protein
MNVQYIIIGILVLIIVAVVITGYFFLKPKVSIIGKGFHIDELESTLSDITENTFISPPKINNAFTIHFGLYVENFYMNHLKWKHILHKGTLRNDIYDYKYWYNIETDIPKQCIGAWLHPDKNTLRFAISTLLKYDNEIDDYPDYKRLKQDLKPNTYKEIIEVCDINDIEPRTLQYFTAVVDEQSLSIYKNGNLIKTCGLRGAVLLNMGDLYFHKQKTYGGKLVNFAYIPKGLNAPKVRELYNKFSK